MEDKKLAGWFCPECGEMFSTHQFANMSLGQGAQVNMSCEQGHKWSEFYSLTYQGFWSKGARYDSFGDLFNKEDKTI